MNDPNLAGWLWLGLLVLVGLAELGLYKLKLPSLSQWVWKQNATFPWARYGVLGALVLLTAHLVWRWPDASPITGDAYMDGLQQVFGTIGEKVLETLMLAAAGAITAYILRVLHQLQKKYGLELDAEKQAKFDRIVADAIRAAEEWIAAKSKELKQSGLETAVVVTPAQKHEMAVTQIMQATGVPSSEASKAVRAMLPQLGLGASANPEAAPCVEPLVEPVAPVTY